MKLDSFSGALIVGAGHGIGLGLVKILLREWKAERVIATYRSEEKASGLKALALEYPERLWIKRLDPLHEDELSDFVAELKKENFCLRLLLNCCGFLHSENFTPEKRLKSFSADYFLASMKINALITPLLLANLQELIPKDEEALVGVLSAKVGSISDNKLGGWYSYRASKAALNMLIKTAAIEFARSHKNLTLISLHPGTTKTDLSEPFLSGTNYRVHTTDESARNILKVIGERTPEETGRFYSWDGTELPW